MLKKLFLLYSICLTTKIFAQTREIDSLKQESKNAPEKDTVIISAKVGSIIDKAEKMHYRIFPYYSSNNFIKAAFIQTSDSTIILETLLQKDSLVKKQITQQEFILIKSIINSNNKAIIRPHADNNEMAREPKKKDTAWVRAQLKKNVFYATLSIMGIGGGISGNYERRIFETRSKLLRSVFLKATAGTWSVWEDSGTLYYLGATSVSGSGNGHFELCLGIAALYRKGYKAELKYYEQHKDPSDPILVSKPALSNYLSFGPSLSLGYRYQNPKGHGLFKTGIGFPEFIYLGFGFCF